MNQEIDVLPAEPDGAAHSTDTDSPVSGEVDQETSSTATAGKTKQPGSRGSLIGWLLFVLLLGAIAIAGYFRAPLVEWLTNQGVIKPSQQLVELSERVARVEKSLVKVPELSAQTTELAADAAQLSDEVVRVTERLLATDQQILEITEALTQQLADWRPIEVRHLLFLANQRLRFAADREGALSALQSADSRLQEINSRRWLPLREKIIAAIAAVNRTDAVDVDGTRLRLHELSRQIDQLSSFAQLTASRLPDTNAQTQTETVEINDDWVWKQRLQNAWQGITEQLRRYVNVERVDERTAPLLGDAQRQGLKFYLRGELLLAEIDLLQGDANFHRRLKNIEEVVGRYFDPQTELAAAISGELQALKRVTVAVTLPDIDEPLMWLDREFAGQVTR